MLSVCHRCQRCQKKSDETPDQGLCTKCRLVCELCGKPLETPDLYGEACESCKKKIAERRAATPHVRTSWSSSDRMVIEVGTSYAYEPRRYADTLFDGVDDDWRSDEHCFTREFIKTKSKSRGRHSWCFREETS